jgi:hypothetical protein
MISLIVYSIPALVYALVVKLREKAPWRDIAGRLGLVAGQRRAYLWSLVGCGSRLAASFPGGSARDGEHRDGGRGDGRNDDVR